MRFHSLILFMLIGALLASCQSNDSVQVIENVRGYTFADGELITFSSIAFEDGKVLETSDENLQEKYSGAEVTDGNDRVMLPGLIDAHGHVMGLGYQEINVNVAGIESLDETLSEIQTYAEENGNLEWIQGRGWNQTRWEENEFPTAADLDEVIEDRPVWLTRVDGHAGWANSRAMEMAGIDANTEAPQGGEIIRDDDGEPTGVFIDAAMDLISENIPSPDRKQREMALEQSLQKMAEHGLTSVHDAGVGTGDWELYTDFADDDKMTTRIYGMISGAGETFDELSEDGPIESYADDLLSLQSVKLYSDGALGSRGAAMIEPYSDDPDNRGLLFESEEEFTRMIMKTASSGYQTNVHAIGDRANRTILNAFETVQDSLGEQGLRHRIEHAQIVDYEEDIPRFEELNLIASMQPTHATSDMNMAEDRVGPDRIKGAYAWQTFLDQGTVVAAGSDFPVEDVNPFYGLYSGITRQDHDGNPEDGWYPEERMSREQTFRAFTIDAAYAAHQEDILGTLESGKWADFILVDRDIFEVPTQEIWQTEVLETWVAGEQVYSAE